MSIRAPVPTFGPQGWIEDPKEMCAGLIQHAYESDFSQSNEHRGSVTSIQNIARLYGHNPDRHASELRVALLDYFGRYFSNVNIEARVIPIEDTNKYEMVVDGQVIVDDTPYSFGASFANDPSTASVKLLQAINQ